MGKISNVLNLVDTKVKKFLSWKWHLYIVFPVLLLALIALYAIFCLKPDVYSDGHGFASRGAMAGFFAIEGVLGLIGVTYLVLEIITKRITAKKITYLVLIGASMCLVAYGFSSSLNVGTRVHDAAIFNKSSHWSVVYDVFNNGEVPAARTGSVGYSSSKVFHFLMSIGMRVNKIFVHVDETAITTDPTALKEFPSYTLYQYHLYDMNRVYMCFVGISTLFLVVKLYEKIGLKGFKLVLASILTLCLPQMWYIHFFVNPDGLALFFGVACLVAAFDYLRSRTWTDLSVTALLLGLTTMTKLQAVLVGIPVAVILIFVFANSLKDKTQKALNRFMLQLFLFVAIFASVGFFVHFYYQIRYGVEFGYVVDNARTLALKKKYSMFIDDSFYNPWQRFLSYPNADLFFSPFNLRVRSYVDGAYVNSFGDIDFNVWTGFVKTLFFDEWSEAAMFNYYGGFITVIICIFEYTYALLLLFGVIGAIYFIYKKFRDKSWNDYFMGLFTGLFILGFMLFFIVWNSSYPYGYSMNSRFIIPIVIPIAILLANCLPAEFKVTKKFINNRRKENMKDLKVAELIKLEEKRQNNGIELIASENYPSKDVMSAQGSIFTAKYAEGFPYKRYYGGCENVDALETLAIERAKQLFHSNYANVQPHSGSQANFAAYHSLLKKGDKVLSLILDDGGHLTHGSPVSFSSDYYQFEFYPLGDDTKLDYQTIKNRLEEFKPNLLLAGYSAYPFEIDFKKIREIIDEYNKTAEVHCYFMVDMAHIAGIVAAGLTQNPVDYADIVTSTTHKTLRGPRGGLILSNNEELGKKINSAVFPYSQGGPLEHVIAAKAICFGEDLKPEFKEYMRGVLDNTKACNDELADLGCVVSGTENHLFLLNVIESFGITGKEAQYKLEAVGITTNKNMIHGDKQKPSLTSGLRIGFAAATSRGCNIYQAREIARLIYKVLKGEIDDNAAKKEVKKITSSWKKVTKLEY